MRKSWAFINFFAGCDERCHGHVMPFRHAISTRTVRTLLLTPSR